jgi:uncharacterized protein (TIGR02117 family)
LKAEANAPAKYTFYVISNGFHSGLVVRKTDVPREIWPEVDAIPDHPWIEIGWGSEVFYGAKKITAPVVFSAVVPNPSVLHVVGWDAPPQIAYAAGDLVRLEVDQAQFVALCRGLHDSYERDEAGNPQYLGPGVYGDSAFFRARGKYYFPNTCNVWTARLLKTAGVTIVPELCSFADPLLMSAGNAGTTIRRR